MIKKLLPLFFYSSIVAAAPKPQMNNAFAALIDLVPFIADKKQFQEKKNHRFITEKVTIIRDNFRSAKHEIMLKQDLFNPSYVLVDQNLEDSLNSLLNGSLDYSFWRLKGLTSLCLDCHTRMPTTFSSSYDRGSMGIDSTKFSNSYDLGIAQMIIRKYPDAKNSFTRDIDEKLLKGESQNLIDPFKQILLIEAKILDNPSDMAIFIRHYLSKKKLPLEVRKRLESWDNQLKVWVSKKSPKEDLKNDQEVKDFISKNALPLKERVSFEDEYSVDTLLISGLLSHYLFNHPKTELAPELNYWIGWTEKYLKNEQFFGSGDLFLKQCILKYPRNPMAPKCLSEYKESIEFEFSGSSGTHIPEEVKKEIKGLEDLINSKDIDKKPK